MFSRGVDLLAGDERRQEEVIGAAGLLIREAQVALVAFAPPLAAGHRGRMEARPAVPASEGTFMADGVGSA